MRMIILTAVACTALVAMPGIALAQSETAPGTAGNSQLKGPPNANGYDKDSGRSAATDSKTDAPSASNMKGPPNANGYQKQ